MPCNPFVSSASQEDLQEALAKGEEDPNACLCTFPCTVDKVAQFVRFYYIKRFFFCHQKQASRNKFRVKN